MRITVDLLTGRFVTSRGVASSPRPFEHKRGDTAAIEVEFCEGVTAATLPEGASLVYGVKERGKYDGDLLLSVTDFTLEDGIYKGTAAFDMTAIDAALEVDGDDSNDVASLEAMAEVSWTTDDGTLSTNTLNCLIVNDVNRADDEELLPSIGAVVALSAEAVLTSTGAFASPPDSSYVEIDGTQVEYVEDSGDASGASYIANNTGLTVAEFLAELEAYINGDSPVDGVNTTFAGRPAAFDELTAVATATTLTVSVDLKGTAGNSKTVSLSAGDMSATFTWDGATFSGGREARNANIKDFVATFERASGEGLSAGQVATARAELGLSDGFGLFVDDDGNIVTAELNVGVDEADPAFSGPGNIHFPANTGLVWYDPDGGNTVMATLCHDNTHDQFGGEMIFSSRWRFAFACGGPMQLGGNSTLRTAYYLKLVSGYASASDTLKPSRVFSFQTHAWDAAYPGGARSIPSEMCWQAHHLDSTGKNVALRLYHDGYVEGSEGESTNSETGSVNDEGVFVTDFAEIAEFSKTGLWTPGTAPAFADLEDDTTVTITCDKHKTFQSHKLVLGGNRTLEISGSENGMRGVIYVEQDATGSRTLTLPDGSATQSSFALSTGAYELDRLSWEFDGSFYYWTIENDIVIAIDSDADTYLTAAGIVDQAEKTALNKFVLGLKNNSLWSKLRAIYPYMGGSASDHAIDLKANSNITWTGGTPTHDANGVTGDGTAFYGDTGLKTEDFTSVNSLFLYTYCRTASPTTGGYFIGASGGTGDRAAMRVDTSTRMTVSGLNGVAINGVLATHAGSFEGHNFASRVGAAEQFARSGGVEYDDTDAAVDGTSVNLYLFARNNGGTAEDFGDHNSAMDIIGDGLSKAEADILETLVQDFQTAMGREV
jgi:hypothetical protein